MSRVSPGKGGSWGVNLVTPGPGGCSRGWQGTEGCRGKAVLEGTFGMRKASPLL